jgi:hypothetical protein
VCIVVCDGLSGLPEAITTVWPLISLEMFSLADADLTLGVPLPVG